MKNSSNRSKCLVGLLMVWIAFAVFGSTIAHGVPTWYTLTPMPTPRSSLQAGVINGLLYVAGGNVGASGTTEVLEVYDPATDTWSTGASMGSYKVYQGAAGVIDNKLYIAGGWNWPLSGIPTNKLKIYDPTTNAWSLGANIPILTGDTVSAVIDRNLYILTAYDGNSGYRKRLFVYDPDTNSWTEKAQPSSIHADASGAALDGLFYVAGGFNGSAYSNMVEAYDPVTNTWSTKASMPTARSCLRAEVFDGNLYAVGGSDDVSLFNVVEIYDPATNTWSIGDSMLTARNGFGSGVINNGLYVVGGCDGGSHRTGNLEVGVIIPAPSAILLGSIGIGLVGWLRRRRTL